MTNPISLKVGDIVDVTWKNGFCKIFKTLKVVNVPTSMTNSYTGEDLFSRVKFLFYLYEVIRCHSPYKCYDELIT